MSLRAVVLLCLTLLTLPAAARQQPEQPQPLRPSLRDLVMKPVVYSVAGMEKVTMRTHLGLNDSK